MFDIFRKESFVMSDVCETMLKDSGIKIGMD